MASVVAAEEQALTVSHLITNGLTNPLGMSVEAPALSWVTESGQRAVTQGAYEIRVADAEQSLSSANVWASGRVDGDAQIDVEYAGPALSLSITVAFMGRVLGFDSVVSWFVDAVCASVSGPGCVRGSAVG